MRFLVYTKNPGGSTRIDLQEEARRRQHTLDIYSPHIEYVTAAAIDELVEHIRTYDLFHYMGGLDAAVSLALDERLAEINVPSVNSKVRVPGAYKHKLYQTLCFEAHGLPTPKSLYGVPAAPESFSTLADLLTVPFVAKVPESSHGEGVYLVHSEYDLLSLPAATPILFQELIPNDGDFRVHVAGGSVAFAPFKRIPQEGNFRANISQGGTMAAVTDATERSAITTLALRAARAMRLDVCGIDIIKHSETGQYYLIESNSNPGMKDTDTVSGESWTSPLIDLYEKLARG